MVVDTSAVLAIFFDEPLAPKIAEILNSNSDNLQMSTVNLTEVLILLLDRLPNDFPKLEEKIYKSSIEFIPPSIRQSQIAAHAHHRFPINLGDCFAYALAVDQGKPLLATDTDFLKTDVMMSAL